MSFAISDLYGEGVSDCCYANVIDPRCEGLSGFCTRCKEHCGIVEEGEA